LLKRSWSSSQFYLKECGFRFNHRNENLPKLVLKMCRDLPLCSA
jgi:hypothetical protein